MKTVLPIIFFVLVGVGYFSSLKLPYHFYQEAVFKGINSPFLQLRKLPDKFYAGQDYSFVKMGGVSLPNEKQWEDLHFNDFKVPFPVRHPAFLVAPWIEKEGRDYLFGFEVLNYNLDVINRVVIRKSERFKLELYHHKIFQLPLFEKMILEKGLEKVWQDVFKKDIFESPYLKSPGLFTHLSPTQIPLTDMVYDLFILTVRERFFPVKLKTINYWAERDMGIIEVTDDELLAGKPTRYLQEVIYHLEGDQIYTIELKTLHEDLMAEKYRQRLLEKISYKKSEKDSSIPLYASFQGLKYEDKLTPNGLIYLYAAFSHQKGSRNFLSQMIRFLERGKNERVYLDPLYDYGYQKFGSNFSTDMEKIKETAEEKLLRKMKEEEAKERARLENDTILDEREKFESKEQKIQFYLQKAKDQGEEKSEDKSLILD